MEAAASQTALEKITQPEWVLSNKQETKRQFCEKQKVHHGFS
jgi:hypothetical protein